MMFGKLFKDHNFDYYDYDVSWSGEPVQKARPIVSDHLVHRMSTLGKATLTIGFSPSQGHF